MDVLNMINIVYKAYESSSLTPVLYQNVGSNESFNGIIIEGYYGIFCSYIITRFGRLRISNGGTLQEISLLDEYIQSRITYKVIIDTQRSKYGVFGPFYLVTHIDGIPIENDDVSGITYDNYGFYIKPNPEGRNQYPVYIEDCIKNGLIKDKGGILDRLLAEPEYYKDAVGILVEGLENRSYFEVFDENIYYHIFGLLCRTKRL